MHGVLWVPLLLLAGLLAGCSGPGPEAPEPVAAVAEPPVPQDEPVDWSATMGSFSCVRSGGVSACGLSGPALTDPLADAEATPTYLQDAEGRDLAGGELTLEWQAVTPTTEALRLVVAAWTGCPDECEENLTVASAIGKSPLRLDLPAKPLAGDDYTVVVRVEPVPFVQGSTVSIGQPVHVTGKLTFVEPAASDLPADPHAMHDGEDDEGPASS